MAKITFGNVTGGVDVAKLDVDDLFDYDAYKTSSTYLKVYDDGSNYFQFNGTGLKFKASGGELVDVTGTVTSMTWKLAGQTALSVTGLDLDAHALAVAGFSGNSSAFLNLVLGGNDTVTGTKYADTLWGGRGADTLKGGSGIDVLIGGAGTDKLYGETGADTFQFKSVSESTMSVRDTIYDFTSADTIDLHFIDASTKSSGNQAFTFKGTAAFTGHAGELRYDLKASDTYIYADINGDKKADFSIHLDDHVALAKGDFWL